MQVLRPQPVSTESETLGEWASGVYLISLLPTTIWCAFKFENHGSSLAISSEVQRLTLASFGGQLEMQNIQPQPDLFIQNPHISLVSCKQVLKDVVKFA